METIISLIATATFALSSIFGFPVTESLPTSSSVELGLQEVSPKGADGGYAIPASGCGVIHNGLPEHECSTTAPDIRVDKPIVRLGDPLTVSWDPKSNVNCALSLTVMRLTDSPNPSSAPNANAVGSRVDEPSGETIYAIVCDGTGNVDIVTAKVLPRIQET